MLEQAAEKLFVSLTVLHGGSAAAIIFIVLVACGLGLPLPEDIPLIAAGYLIWAGHLHYWLAFLLTMFAILLGDSALYFIGRRVGDVMNVKFFNPEKVARAQQHFETHGDKVVFFARFVAGIRAIAFFSAGALKMPYSRFIMFDGLAALITIPIWLTLGYFLGVYFGHEITQLLSAMERYKDSIVLAVMALLAVIALSLTIRYLNSRPK